jgi:hypothetical protein
MMDMDGTWVCFRVPSPAVAKQVCETFEQDKQYDLTLKKRTRKRSLDANRYFWQLLDKMADVLERRKEDLYLEYVKQCGPFKDFTLTEDEAKTFKVAWSMLGTGWPTEQVDYDEDGEHIILRAYYGSSRYNTKQMSRLIDMVVEDAKELGIETMTPDELCRLKGAWHGNT